MSTSIFNRMTQTLLAMVLLVSSAGQVCAQTTEFTYQGKLSDGGTPANGNYDFEFMLYDALAGGTAQGLPVQRLNVAVSSGIFTVQLDFGNQFNGANRFLDISVKAAGGTAFTPLTPRQRVTSNPYAIKSLNSSTADGLSLACVNCVTSSQIQGLQGSKVTGSISGSQITGEIPVGSVPPGSNHYIRTGGALQAADINISGSIEASGFESAVGYYIGGSAVLTTPGVNNIFAGLGTGLANSSGGNNAFFGHSAGLANSTGSFNTFVGRSAGQASTTGGSNSFFGRNAGLANTTGSSNTLIGSHADVATGNLVFATAIGGNAVVDSSNTIVLGRSGGLDTVKVPGVLDVATQYNIGGSRVLSVAGIDNTFAGRGAGAANSGASNAFFGRNAGLSNTIGGSNSFLGTSAGQANTEGSNNSFFGRSAGLSNTTGDDNSFFGRSAGLTNTTGNNNSFFGRSAGAVNSIGVFNSFFGALAGDSNTTGLNNTFLGGAAGGGNTSGSGNTFVGLQAGEPNSTGDNNAFFGANAGITNTTGSSNTYIGFNAGGEPGITNATAIGANAHAFGSNQIYIGTPSNIVRIPGSLETITLRIIELASAGSTAVCRNALKDLATCSSSLRYKTNIAPFSPGLSLVNRLRPITFDWKEGGMHDLGLGAEDVAAIEPLLVTYNKEGQVEGVKYDRIGVVLLNAVKEQQQIITAQQQRAEQQEQRLEDLEEMLEKQNREIQSLKDLFASSTAASRGSKRK